MWIRKKRLHELMKAAYVQGYNWGFRMGELHAMKQILRWRRIPESEPMGAVASEIEEILKRKGFEE